jgi:hypothetical protein
MFGEIVQGIARKSLPLAPGRRSALGIGARPRFSKHPVGGFHRVVLVEGFQQFLHVARTGRALVDVMNSAGPSMTKLRVPSENIHETLKE